MTLTVRRIVRLLADPPKLTGRQLAQRKYRRSAKGRAANARAHDKRRDNPTYRAKSVARVRRWRHANLLHVRVYNRVLRRRRRMQQRPK